MTGKQHVLMLEHVILAVISYNFRLFHILIHVEIRIGFPLQRATYIVYM